MCLGVEEEVGPGWRLRLRSWGAPEQSRDCFRRCGWRGSFGFGDEPIRACGGGLLDGSALLCRTCNEWGCVIDGDGVAGVVLLCEVEFGSRIC